VTVLQGRRSAGSQRRAGSRNGQAYSDFLGEVHVYVPHVVGLPPLRPYLRELWRRRQFALELSRSNLRAQHYNTGFGQLWLVLNPLLLGLVYFVLVDILRADDRDATFLAHLLGTLFAFYFVSNSVSDGSNSVTNGSRLILNTAFPRLLLPLSSVITAVMRFLPTIAVYAAMHLVAGYPIGVHLLLMLPLFALLVVFAAGVAMLFAALQVYFRDVKSLMPYILRVWLYLSPVLYYVREVPEELRRIIAINPLYYLLGAWADVLDGGGLPALSTWAVCLAWAVGALLIGGLFFLSREREFAVRL